MLSLRKDEPANSSGGYNSKHWCKRLIQKHALGDTILNNNRGLQWLMMEEPSVLTIMWLITPLNTLFGEEPGLHPIDERFN